MLTEAIILAGGFGTRLQSVVSDVPKPMAPLNNEPFLNYVFDYLKHFQIKHVVLSTGYLSEKISDHYKHLVLIGICGGLSTFSTFSYETFELIKQGLMGWALVNIIVSCVLCTGIFFAFAK